MKFPNVKAVEKNEGDGNIIIIKKWKSKKEIEKKPTVLVLKDNNDIRSVIFGSQKIEELNFKELRLLLSFEEECLILEVRN